MLSCSQQSVFSAMDRFVKAVNNMSATVLVPSKLRDMDMHSNCKMTRLPPALASSDLHSFYLMLNDIKKELLWGPTTGALAAATMVTNGTTIGATRGVNSTTSNSTATTASSIAAPSSSSSSASCNSSSVNCPIVTPPSSSSSTSSGFSSSTNSIINCNGASMSNSGSNFNLNGYLCNSLSTSSSSNNNSACSSVKSGFVPYSNSTNSYNCTSSSTSLNLNTIESSPSLATVSLNTVTATSMTNNTSIFNTLNACMSNVNLNNHSTFSGSRQHSRQPSDESIGSLGGESVSNTSASSNSPIVHSNVNTTSIYCDRDSDSEIDSLLNDRDDEHNSHLATAFRHHLQGLHTILHQLADSADYLSSRYQEEIEGSSP